MKTCFIYSFIAPVSQYFKDSGDTPPLATVPVELKDGRLWEVAILGTQQTVTAVRISIPNTPDEQIAPDDFRRFLRLRSYMLDCIRMAYEPTAEYFRRGDDVIAAWNFLKPEVGPQFAIQIKEPLNPDYRVNAEGIRLLVAAPPEMRPIVHLLADGSDFRLPLQFRFLSYYKIIEMHYRVTPNPRFSDFIASFIPDFREIYPDVESVAVLCNRLSQLRNRCAHIKLTTGDLGFSHLEAETEDLFRAMPVIRRVATKCVAVNYPGSPLRFTSTPEEAVAQFQEMEREGLRPVRITASP